MNTKSGTDLAEVIETSMIDAWNHGRYNQAGKILEGALDDCNLSLVRRPKPEQTLVDAIQEIADEVPDEAWANVPTDMAKTKGKS